MNSLVLLKRVWSESLTSSPAPGAPASALDVEAVRDNPFSMARALRMMRLKMQTTPTGAPRKLHLAYRALRSSWTGMLDPVFLIGAPRSGTTFLGDCFSGLESVIYHHEPENTKCAIAEVYAGRSRELMAHYYRLQYRYLISLSAKKTAQLFIEKTPRNCFIVPFLAQVFPRARFIHLIRDGRDSAYSNAKMPWLQAKSTGRVDTAGYPMGAVGQFWLARDDCAPFAGATDLERCAWAWKAYAGSALEGLARVPEQRVLTLRYEQLVHDPEATAQSCARFIELDDAHDQRRLTEALLGARVSSVGAAGRQLPTSEFDHLTRQCQPLLSDLGYGRT